MKNINISQGHWLLAKMGKKVLRPGGKELTLKLIENINITKSDSIVEFTPGLGFTAKLALKYNPKSYLGIELNEEAASILKKKINGKNRKIIVENTSKTSLKSDSIDKIYCEAMLTMQSDLKKLEIIKEAFRILKKGGLYAIHELGLIPNNIETNVKSKIQKELSKSIKVNVRPLTESEWIKILQNKGFKIKKILINSMRLLETKRIIDNEGFFRTLKIFFNILINRSARKRILSMRKVFKTYSNQINAIVLIAEK